MRGRDDTTEREVFSLSACTPPPANAPVIQLTLVGIGEPLLRLERRLNCAAAAAGLKLVLEIRKDTDSLGISYAQTPVVLHAGRPILSGLPRTEAIEAWLRHTFTGPPDAAGKGHQ